MARVDHDCVATAGHGGQTGWIHRCATWSEATRRKPGRGSPREVTLTQIIQPLGGQTGEGQFPAVRGCSPQLQLIGIEFHTGTELHHQPRGPGSGFAQSDLLDRTATRQPTGKAQLTREVDPDAGAAAIAGILKKGLEPGIAAGSQLQRAVLSQRPGRQGTGRLDRQRRQQQTELQGHECKAAPSAGCHRRHRPQNKAGLR